MAELMAHTEDKGEVTVVGLVTASTHAMTSIGGMGALGRWSSLLRVVLRMYWHDQRDEGGGFDLLDQAELR